MCRLLSKYHEILLPLFVVFFAVKYLLGLSDEYGILMLAFGVFAFVIQPMSMKTFVPLDWAVTIFSAVNFALSFSGGPTAQALSEAAFFALCLAAYYAVKQKDLQHIDVSLTIFFAVSAVALAVGIVAFFVFRHNVLGAEFPDVYDFRFLYRPLGFTCNFWAESVVVLAALSLYMGKFRHAFFALAFLAALLTFSRGAYIALAVLAAGFLVVEKSKTGRKKFLLSVSAALIFTALFCNVELLKTMSFNTQTTQQQSTAWRLEAAGSDWDVIREQPVIGHGAESYGDVTGKSHDYNSRKNFSGVAPNVFSKAGVEKGISGILAMLYLIAMVAREIRLHFHNRDIKIAAVVLAVILTKELTQSSFAENRFTIFVCYMLFALMAKQYRLGCSAYEFPLMRWCVYAMYAAIFVGIGGRYFDELRFTKPYSEAVKEYLYADNCINAHNISGAEPRLKKLCVIYPSCGEFNFKLGKVYLAKMDTLNAVEHIVKSICLQPRIIDSKDFQRFRETDSTFYNRLKNSIIDAEHDLTTPQDYARLGFIHHRFGLEAEPLLKSAVEKMPSLSTPWLLLGDTAKYNILTAGAFQGESHKIINAKDFTVCEMFIKTYAKVQY